MILFNLIFFKIDIFIVICILNFIVLFVNHFQHLLWNNVIWHSIFFISFFTFFSMASRVNSTKLADYICCAQCRYILQCKFNWHRVLSCLSLLAESWWWRSRLKSLNHKTGLELKGINSNKWLFLPMLSR